MQSRCTLSLAFWSILSWDQVGNVILAGRPVAGMEEK